MDAAVETYRRLGFAEHKLSYAPNIAFAIKVPLPKLWMR